MRRLLSPVIALAIFTALSGLMRQEAAGTMWGLPEAAQRDIATAISIGFWLTGAWLANTVIAAAIRSYARRHEAGTQVPKLLIDVSTVLVYFIAILIIISHVFEQSLSGLLATSGFFAAVIGLAAQKTISDVFGGIALNADQVIRLGDWIETSTNVIGRITEITWRSTHLLTVEGRLVVIPNSMLVANQFTNFNAPYPHFRITRTIRMDYSVPAERVIDILQCAMEATDDVLRDPSPQVTIEEVLNGGILYNMNFWIRDYSAGSLIARNVMVNALKFLDRGGLAPALPRQGLVLLDHGPRHIETGIDVRTVLQRTPFFQFFTPATLERLEREVRIQEFAPGSVIVREGDLGASLFILIAGLLEASKRGQGAEARIVGQLTPGDVLGEMSLLAGAARSATVTARTQATLLEIRKEQLEPILAEHPEAIAELGRLQADRLARNQDALALSPEERGEVQAVGLAAFLGRKIRRFFARAEF
jgi:small-conductance mechanosensitive channel/CRP-like cAMP-binding protein